MELCRGRLIEEDITRHNRDPINMHVKPNQTMIMSHQFGNEVIHWGMTSLNILLNIARVINAGEITLLMDGTFRVCQNEVCVPARETRYQLVGHEIPARGTRAGIYHIAAIMSRCLINCTLNHSHLGPPFRSEVEPFVRAVL